MIYYFSVCTLIMKNNNRLLLIFRYLYSFLQIKKDLYSSYVNTYKYEVHKEKYI